MSNIDKVNEMLINDPELQGKLNEEIKRLLDSGEVTDKKEVLGKATANVLNVELTGEELDALFTAARSMTPEQLEQVSGGINFGNVLKWAGIGFGIGATTGGIGGTWVGGPLFGVAAAVVCGAGGAAGGAIGALVQDPDFNS